MPNRCRVFISLVAGIALLSGCAAALEPQSSGEDGTSPDLTVDVPDGVSDEDLEQRLPDREDPGALAWGQTVMDDEGLAVLSLRLGVPRDEFVLGEPIVATATLTNHGSDPVEIAPVLDPTFGLARYEIQDPNGARLAFDPFFHRDGIALPAQLEPGGIVERPVALYLGRGGATFAEPGEYRIRGAFGAVSSEDVVVVVSTPDPGDEQRVAEVMLRDDVLTFLFVGGGEHLAEPREQLVALIEQSPETPHAAYAYYGLSRYWSTPGRDFERGVVRAADLDLAEQLFEQAVSTGLPAPLQIDAAAALVAGAIVIDEIGRAEQLLDDFQARFGQEPLARIEFEVLAERLGR